MKGLLLLLSLGLLSSALTAEDKGEQNKDYCSSAAKYAALLAAGENSPELHSNYGLMLHLCGGQEEAALAQFRTALKLNPDLKTSNLFAGIVLLHLSRPKEALPYLQRAQQLMPGDKQPALLIARAYLSEKNYGAAMDAFQRVTRAASSDPDAWFGLGVSARGLADQMMRKSLQQNAPTPTNVKPLLQTSLAALSRAVALQPGSSRAHLLLAEALRDQGKTDEAIPEYQEAIRLDPRSPGPYLGLAATYWKSGDYDEALPALSRVLELTPNDAETHAILADILLKRNDPNAARQHAERALRENPNLPAARFTLAKLELTAGHTQQALDLIQPALPADMDGAYHFFAYRVLRNLGRTREAEQALARYKEIRRRKSSPLSIRLESETSP